MKYFKVFRVFLILFVILSIIVPPTVIAQSGNSSDKDLLDLLDPKEKTKPEPEPYAVEDLSGWPYYLYRYFAITIGSFPFSLLAATIVYDTYKVIDQSISMNNFESQYLPLFFGGASKPSYDSDEVLRVILIGGGISLLVATIDLIISLVQNNYQESTDSLFYGIQ